MAKLTIECSDGMVAYLEERAARLTAKAGKPVTVAQALVVELDYARARRETLARDAEKQAKLKAEGPRSGVKRKRYQPRFPDAKVAAEGTPEAVKEWASDAPEPHGGMFD